MSYFSVFLLQRQIAVALCVLVKTYYHGEPISVNVSIANASSKTVKKIKITGACVWMINAALVFVHKYVVLKFNAPSISHSTEFVSLHFHTP